MLRAIHIKRFGVFHDASFALGPVTVFNGANQSGKSTLFDAIRIETFHPERRGKANQALYARYGDGLDVHLDWSDGPPEMTDAEFMNLFAVSGGNLRVDLDGDWLAGVKRSLFAGGIDPRSLMDAFAQLSSEKGSLRHMRARKELSERRDQAEQELDGLQARRDETLGALEAQEAARAELQGLVARIGTLKGEETTLAEEVHWQERIAERARCEAHLALLDEIARLEQAQEARRAFATDRTGELDGLEKAAADARMERIRTEEAQSAAATQLKAARDALGAMEKELQAREAWPEAVQTLEARMAAQRDGHLTRVVMRGALAAFLIVLGVAGVVSFGHSPWSWVGLLAAIAVALGLFTALPWLDERRLLRELKERWRMRLAGTHTYARAQLVAEAESLDGLVEGLAQVSAELEHVRAEHAAQVAETQAAAARHAETEAALTAAQTAEQAASTALANWLGALGVASRDEYRDRRNAYLHTHGVLEAAYARQARALSERGLADAGALRAEAGSALERLVADGVPAEGLTEPERAAVREKLDALRAELADRQAEHHAKDRASHGQAERLVGSLGTLPEQIAEKYETIREAEAGIAALDLERRAAARALELFQAVAEDETTVLADLSRLVAAVFARISSLAEARQGAVALAGLRSAEIRALDRGGASRPVDHLSSGAQQLLYLALRLAMAERERRGRFALLCLDEPFAFLDPERQMETLVYLREFLEQTGWQLVLFTNEPAQAERARAVFPECQLYRLG